MNISFRGVLVVAVFLAIIGMVVTVASDSIYERFLRPLVGSYTAPSSQPGSGRDVVFEPFVVNVGEKGSSLLRMEMTLSTPTDLVARVLETEPLHMGRLRDDITTMLSQKEPQWLATDQGKGALKSAIAEIANKHGKGPVTADDIHFSVFTVRF